MGRPRVADHRAGVAKPEFRRNDATTTLGGPLRRGRTTTFFGAAQRQAFKSSYASEPFTAKSNVFIDPLLRTPYLQQWTSSLQYELRRGMVADVGYVGSRGVGLLGKINRAVPINPG